MRLPPHRASQTSNRHQIREQRISRLSEAGAALDDRDLAEEIRLKNDGILLPLEAGEQIVGREVDRTDARPHRGADPLRAGNQLHAASASARREPGW